MDTKQELILKLCDKDEQGKPIKGSKPGEYLFFQNAEAFTNEFQQLLDQEVEIDTDKVSIPEEEFDKIGGWCEDDLEAITMLVDIKLEKSAKEK